MGGLRKKMPITYITMLLSTMAIAGVPLFSGFYSKDAIIAATLHPAPGYASILGENGAQGFLWSLPKFIIPIAAFMTAFYMFRLIIMTFHGKPKSEHAEHAKESPISVTLPLMILAVLSVFAASPWIFNFDVFGHHIWFNELVAPMTFDSAGTLSLPSRVEIVDHGWLPVIISLVVAGSGIFLAFAVYQWKIINAASIAKAFGPVYTLVYRKYFIDEFVMRFIVKPLVFTWNVWCAAFDKFVIDGIVNGVGRTTKRLASGAGWWDKNVVDGSVNLLAFVTQIFAAISRIFQTGFLQHYLTTLAIFAVVGLAMFGGWMQWVLLGAIPVSFVGFVYLTRRA